MFISDGSEINETNVVNTIQIHVMLVRSPLSSVLRLFRRVYFYHLHINYDLIQII